MYARYLSAAGGDPSGIRDARVPPPAHRFISEHRRIVSEEPFLVGLGAVGPGHEWAIPELAIKKALDKQRAAGR